MPLEASSLIGSIGGIAELAKASFSDEAPARPPAAKPAASVPKAGVVFPRPEA